MKFQITLTPNANEDIKYFQPYAQKVIIAAIRSYLQVDAHTESHRRKRLRPSELAPWELKVGKYRVFYTLEGRTAKIVAIGYKEHNDLFIRGRRVEL
jgi:mRNA-degrading endonuclease RelE of RelBE toxin-antitoxin system